MWNVKTKVIPVLIRTTGTISKSLIQYLRNIRRKREIKELQKIAAILGTAHILPEVLMLKYEITLYVAQTVNTEHLRHYIF